MNLDLNIFQSARKLFFRNGSKIKLKRINNEGKAFFEVPSKSSDGTYTVTLNKWNKMNCDCEFGSTHGQNGSLCSHKLAVLRGLFYAEEHNRQTFKKGEEA